MPVLVAPPPLAVLASRPSRCLGRVARSGCSLPSPASTPFHVVCLLRPRSGCPFVARRVSFVCCCARPPAVFSSPPLPLPFGAHPSQGPLLRLLVGPFQEVHTPPRLLLRSLPLLVVGVLAFPFLFRGGVEVSPGWGTLPPRTVRPWGRRPGPAALASSGAGSASVGARHQPHIARSCELALCAVGGSRRLPVGGASCLCEGCPGSDTLPTPTVRTWGVQPGSAALFLWVRGGAGVGSARSCELALRTVRTALGRPGGGALVPL